MLGTSCSEKLERYLKKVETETGLPIEIMEIPNSELYKMKSAFVYNPKSIKILLAAGSQRTEPEIKQSIAHEATHGLLVHKMKYCVGFFKRQLNEKEKKLVAFLFTMVSDIVVNKIIQDEGFLPHSPYYPDMVKEEIEFLEKGLELYDQYLNDPPYRDKIMVFRYIVAWGYFKFIELDDNTREVLSKFMNDFQLKYTAQLKMAMNIQGIILMNDIFTADGYRKTIEQLLTLWELEDLIELRTV